MCIRDRSLIEDCTSSASDWFWDDTCLRWEAVFLASVSASSIWARYCELCHCAAAVCCLSVLLSLIHISEPTRLLSISYAVFCLKKKKKNTKIQTNTQKNKRAASNN
eukprot:TRINITY_DN13433_c0_g1_i3.p1 TRINITY_DN13433_c0_g1~~TRINITY_DN13433_c0_g1_i3.p1  ORF type:complete len:107 (-),score=39.26 TRINITY_DN13433_c0_g1_i3:13-333(-)